MVDLFCGAGGTSLGALVAFWELGLEAQLAVVNHWIRAVETHERNHPGHLHFCTGVDRVPITDLFADNAGLFALLASPSCTNQSRARGGAPINDQDRSTIWAVVRWLRAKRAIHGFVENVPEVVDYGPLMQKRDSTGIARFLQKDDRGIWRECYAPEIYRPRHLTTRQWWKALDAQGIKPFMVPDPKRKGEYFRKWVRAIRKLGYLVEWRVLNAADFGAPTRRRRFFLQAVLRESGRRIVWPNPVFCDPRRADAWTDGMRPWRTFREVVDLADRGRSIFGRKKLLADKTLKRIAIGLVKFAMEDALIKFKGTGTANSLDAPIDTIQAGGQHYGLIQPVVRVIRDKDRGELEPFVVEVNHGNSAREGDSANNRRVKSVHEPIGALTTSRSHALALPAVVHRGDPAERPFIITDAESLAEMLKAACARSQSEPEYRPLISFNGMVIRLDVFFRMVRWRELARAQSFPDEYEFLGTDEDRIRMIGNAVPPALARAIVKAAVSQNPDVGEMPNPALALRAA